MSMSADRAREWKRDLQARALLRRFDDEGSVEREHAGVQGGRAQPPPLEGRSGVTSAKGKAVTVVGDGDLHASVADGEIRLDGGRPRMAGGVDERLVDDEEHAVGDGRLDAIGARRVE